MKIFKLLFLLSIILMSHSIYAQSSANKVKIIDGQRKHKYLFQDKLYAKDQLGFLFKEDTPICLAYEKAIKKLNDGKRLGYLTLGVIGVAAIPIVADNNVEGESWLSMGDRIGLTAIIFITPISGTAALLKHFDGKRKLKKVLKIFNELHADKYGREIEQPIIGLSSQGIGVQIKF